ncbi:protein EXECUTER 1, chloroplastic [Silene latifolia]|uniref:protein EXECUTER 1, chloroplastic n=1 Tax=Silene latifolia TaxID=37657 RepID=UPI003D76ADD7
MTSSPIPSAPPFSPPSISSDAHHSAAVSLSSSSFKSPFYRKPNSSTLCCCRSSSSSDASPPQPSSSPFQQFFDAAARMFDDFVNSRSVSPEKGEVVEKESTIEDVIEEIDVDDWDWERWQLHFREIDEQERLITLLKSQINEAISSEDYEEAARLKVALAAAATKDAVGSVMSFLKNAVEEERYQDAIFVRDNASAGLVGWWAGFSDDKSDPYGCIIRISAEHGRYVARSYSPRQLASSLTGAPLFEVFVTLNSKGEYKQQAVYLKREAVSDAVPSIFPMSSAAASSIKLGPGGGKTDIFAPVVEDDEDKDDPDTADGFPGFQNVLQDMVPGVRVKVFKVTAPEKVDQDLISKVVEQIIEEDDDDDDKDFEVELDGGDTTDLDDGAPGESDGEKDESEMEAAIGDLDMGDQNEISVKVVVKGAVEKLYNTGSSRELVRVPASLKSKGRTSFSFSIPKNEDKVDPVNKDKVSAKQKAKTKGLRGVEHVMSDLVGPLSRGEKIPIKVLKDIGDLISVTISQAQNRQPLSGSTTFSRIDLPAYPDPLNGLYIGSHGPHTSEVIHLKRKFGQWQEDRGSKGPSDLRFYEYVEAVKLTGDPYVPAGQVAFRAKIGKGYQLPHKGIIPEELGVVARYKGQGRLAEPGFKKPRWVDGELVILDGKHIKSGPVVGFVYWDPKYQFLVFFNRLRIQD